MKRDPRPKKSQLPGKGWCFHRGAKLVRSEQFDHEAVWACPSCQNVTALHKEE